MTEPDNTAPIPATPHSGSPPYSRQQAPVGPPTPPTNIKSKPFPNRGAAIGLAAGAAVVGLIFGAGATAAVGAIAIATSDGTHDVQIPGLGNSDGGNGGNDGNGEQRGQDGPGGLGRQAQGDQGSGQLDSNDLGSQGTSPYDLGTGNGQAPHGSTGQS